MPFARMVCAREKKRPRTRTFFFPRLLYDNMSWFTGDDEITKKKKLAIVNNKKAADEFRKSIGTATAPTKGTFAYFREDGCLKMNWTMKRLEYNDDTFAGLILTIKPTRFYPPKPGAETNLVRLAYLRFAQVAAELCKSKGWQLAFDAVDEILHGVLQPDVEFDEGVAKDYVHSKRLPQNLQSEFEEAIDVYESKKLRELGGCGGEEAEGNSAESAVTNGRSNKSKAVAKELDERLGRSRLNKEDRDKLKEVATKAAQKLERKDISPRQIARLVLDEIAKTDDRLVVRRPFYMCRNGNCDGTFSSYCTCDEYGCCDDDDDGLVRAFEGGFRRTRWRRPYWSPSVPGRIVVLGRSGKSAAAADLRRRFPDREVHVRKWGSSANSYLRENPLTSRNSVEVYGPSRASRASLRALARGSRRGADLSMHY